VVLSTDDEGVSRSDMTHEYQRAVQEQGVDYATLKQIARNGLTYAFIPGASLWADDGIAPGAACAASLHANAVTPDTRCQTLLSESQKARMQWQLERDFTAFETQRLKGAH
jgi:adenosine deaminase